MRNQFLFLTVGAAILNGIFSPLLLFIFLLRWTWYPYFLPQYQEMATMVSALILSSLTLMIAGVPAALLERARRTNDAAETSDLSALIWLAGTVLLTIPALPNILRALS
jgi:hypothetical protein